MKESKVINIDKLLIKCVFCALSQLIFISCSKDMDDDIDKVNIMLYGYWELVSEDSIPIPEGGSEVLWFDKEFFHEYLFTFGKRYLHGWYEWSFNSEMNEIEFEYYTSLYVRQINSSWLTLDRDGIICEYKRISKDDLENLKSLCPIADDEFLY